MRTLEKIIIINIAISCILNQYAASVSTYGLLCSLGLTFYVLFKRKQIKIDKRFLDLFLILSVQQLCCVILFDLDFIACLKQVLTMLIITIITSISFEVNSFKYLYKVMKIVGIIATIAVIFQAFQLYVLHQSIAPITLFDVSEEIVNWSQSTRPMGFFSEVQVYCSSMLPLFAFSIQNKDYKLSIFIGLGFLLSGSSLGILSLPFVIAYYLLKDDVVSNKIKGLIIGICIIAVIMFLSLSAFSEARDKILSIFSEFGNYKSLMMTNKYAYTNYLRLFKAFDTYNAYPLLEKVIGTGCHNTLNYLNNSSITVPWYSLWNTKDVMAAYYTTGFGVFIECGIIGAISYYFFFYSNYRKANSEGKIILLLIVFQGFLTQFFYNGLFAYYILLFYAFNGKKNCRTVTIRI